MRAEADNFPRSSQMFYARISSDQTQTKNKSSSRLGAVSERLWSGVAVTMFHTRIAWLKAKQYFDFRFSNMASRRPLSQPRKSENLRARNSEARCLPQEPNVLDKALLLASEASTVAGGTAQRNPPSKKREPTRIQLTPVYNYVQSANTQTKSPVHHPTTDRAVCVVVTRSARSAGASARCISSKRKLPVCYGKVQATQLQLQLRVGQLPTGAAPSPNYCVDPSLPKSRTQLDSGSANSHLRTIHRCVNAQQRADVNNVNKHAPRAASTSHSVCTCRAFR